MNPYESDRHLSEYLLLHYGTPKDILGSFPGPAEACGFPNQVIASLLDLDLLGAGDRALDIGCAVGGSSFALSRFCPEVLGMDFSEKFIQAAKHLTAFHSLDFLAIEEGERTKKCCATLPEGVLPSRVSFSVGDALALPQEAGEFSVVLASNLLCRLSDPRKFLRRLPTLVAPGGQLLLSTPFSWLEEFTPKSAWLGGKATGESSLESLFAELEPDFSLAKKVELPFLIREHARKFQYGIACGTRWIRKKSK